MRRTARSLTHRGMMVCCCIVLSSPTAHAVGLDEQGVEVTVEADATPLQFLSPGATPPAALQRAREVANRPLAERISAISAVFLDAPYLLDPAGEGVGHDADPIGRYDAFDCLTFVEEVLALAWAGDPAHATSIRLALRYGDATPAYGSRRHFMELQWIPGNVKDGWLVDVSEQYGVVTNQQREIDHQTWQQWRGRSAFAMADEELPLGSMELNLLPIDVAKSQVAEFRAGSILMVVRTDQPHRGPVWITHVGLVIDGIRPTIRHATRISGRVRDHSLSWYLDLLDGYEVWPAAGVVVYEPVDFGPRRARLPEGGIAGVTETHSNKTLSTPLSSSSDTVPLLVE